MADITDEKICITLESAKSEAFSKLIDHILDCLKNISCDLSDNCEEDEENTNQSVSGELASILKGYVSPKIAAPSLENQLTQSKILHNYEQARSESVKRQILEIQHKRERLKLQNEQIVLAKQRIELALEALEMSSKILTRDKDGNVTLFLSNDD